MSETSSSSTSTGIGLFGLTFLVLLVLKCIGYFPYSWFWVFSPLLIGFSLFIFCLVLIIIVAILKD